MAEGLKGHPGLIWVLRPFEGPEVQRTIAPIWYHNTRIWYVFTSWLHLLESTFEDGVPGSAGKSQKEGQEDEGEVKEISTRLRGSRGGGPLSIITEMMGLRGYFLCFFQLFGGIPL